MGVLEAIRPAGRKARTGPEDHEEKIKQAASECQCQDRRAGEAWLASWTIVEIECQGNRAVHDGCHHDPVLTE